MYVSVSCMPIGILAMLCRRLLSIVPFSACGHTRGMKSGDDPQPLLHTTPHTTTTSTDTAGLCRRTFGTGCGHAAGCDPMHALDSSRMVCAENAVDR
jgi:hypothetical protein